MKTISKFFLNRFLLYVGIFVMFCFPFSEISNFIESDFLRKIGFLDDLIEKNCSFKYLVMVKQQFDVFSIFLYRNKLADKFAFFSCFLYGGKDFF